MFWFHRFGEINSKMIFACGGGHIAIDMKRKLSEFCYSLNEAVDNSRKIQQ